MPSFSRLQEIGVGKKTPVLQAYVSWSILALSSLKSLRARIHETHTTHAASGKLGSCDICGDGLNELIRRGEELFP